MLQDFFMIVLIHQKVYDHVQPPKVYQQRHSNIIIKRAIFLSKIEKHRLIYKQETQFPIETDILCIEKWVYFYMKKHKNILY